MAARDAGARARFLSFRQRVYGAAAAAGPGSDIGGPANIRYSSRGDRGRRRRGVAGAQMAEGRTRSGPPRRDGVYRRGIRPHSVRARARADHGDLRVPPRRRVVDAGADEALCLGAGGAARFGATTVGSAVWGKLSAMEGLPIAYFVAAACLLLAVPLTWRWKLQTGVEIDFSPATHWRAATIMRNVENNRGPVLAVVEYRVDAANRAEFLGAVDELGHARRRDGAYAWGVYEDVADAGRFLETFTVESWLELMHLSERVSNADEMLINRVRHLLAGAPRITLSVSPERPHWTWRTQNGGSGRGQVGTPQD